MPFKNEGGRVGIWASAHWGLMKHGLFRSGRNMGLRPLGPNETWAVCASKQSFYATDWPSDYWSTAQVIACPGKNGYVKPSKHISLFDLVGWLFWKHVLVSKSPTKWRQRPKDIETLFYVEYDEHYNISPVGLLLRQTYVK